MSTEGTVQDLCYGDSWDMLVTTSNTRTMRHQILLVKKQVQVKQKQVILHTGKAGL